MCSKPVSIYSPRIAVPTNNHHIIIIICKQQQYQNTTAKNNMFSCLSLTLYTNQPSKHNLEQHSTMNFTIICRSIVNERIVGYQDYCPRQRPSHTEAGRHEEDERAASTSRITIFPHLLNTSRLQCNVQQSNQVHAIASAVNLFPIIIAPVLNEAHPPKDRQTLPELLLFSTPHNNPIPPKEAYLRTLSTLLISFKRGRLQPLIPFIHSVQ